MTLSSTRRSIFDARSGFLVKMSTSVFSSTSLVWPAIDLFILRYFLRQLLVVGDYPSLEFKEYVRYFLVFARLCSLKTKENYCILFHTNQICIICLKCERFIINGNSDEKSVSFPLYQEFRLRTTKIALINLNQFRDSGPTHPVCRRVLENVLMVIQNYLQY